MLVRLRTRWQDLNQRHDIIVVLSTALILFLVAFLFPEQQVTKLGIFHPRPFAWGWACGTSSLLLFGLDPRKLQATVIGGTLAALLLTVVLPMIGADGYMIGMLGGIIGVSGGIAGGLFGTQRSIRSATGPAERSFVLKYVAALWASILLFVAIPLVLRLAGSISSSAYWTAWAFFMVIFFPGVIWANRKQKEIRRSESSTAVTHTR